MCCFAKLRGQPDAAALEAAIRKGEKDILPTHARFIRRDLQGWPAVELVDPADPRLPVAETQWSITFLKPINVTASTPGCSFKGDR